MKVNAQLKNEAAMSITPQVSLDLCGVSSPGPLPTVKKAMNALHNGQVLQLLTNFPSMEEDLFLWAKQTNNQVLLVDKTHAKGYAFYILKGDPWPANKTVDTSGSHCPTPIIEASKCLAAIQQGEVVKLISTCEASPVEVNTWVRSTRHKLLGMTEDARNIYRFYIRK